MTAETTTVTTQSDTDKEPGTRPRMGRKSRSGGIALLAVTAALAGCGSSGSSTSSNSANHDPSGGSKLDAGRLHVEIADNHLGTDLFGSPEGAAVPDDIPSSIRYGTHVLVRCFVPNQSGMSSINDFYLIAGGVDGHLKDIRGTYAPANTFANGGPMGNNPDTIDPNVPEC